MKVRRCPNFTNVERSTLMDIIAKYKAVIESKACDTTSLLRKAEAWKVVTREFAVRCEPRDVKSLKNLYGNTKRNAKKKAVQGRQTNEDIDSVDDTSCEDNKPEITDTKVEVMDDNFCAIPEVLLEPENDQLAEDHNQPLINDIPAPKPTTNRTNWNPLEYNKIKTPITRKFRNIAPLPIMGDYYKRKIELIDKEIKKSVLEQEEILIRRKRDTEEHEKKMILMDLDIKLKQKMLLEK